MSTTPSGTTPSSTTPGGTTPGGTMPSMSELQSRLSQAVREHWKLFLIEGIILVILGILAILVPPLATIAVTILIGWLFLISGVAGLITTFGARNAPGFWWSLLSALLGIAAGLVLGECGGIVHPPKTWYACLLTLPHWGLAEAGISAVASLNETQ